MAQRLSPIIRWAGSKRKLLPRLAPFYASSAGKYIEPFAGSAALFFDLAPPEAVLSDVNSELMATYRAIVRSPREVYEAATSLPASREQYLRLRRTDPGSLNDIARAARFLYLNRYCFNGLYRTDRRGYFNVPFAPVRSGSFPAWENFEVAAKLLSRAILLNADFEAVLRRHVRPGDFVYLDPPYAIANRRIFRQYGPQTFGLADLERVASCLYAIDALGAKFLLSYAYSAESRTFFREWRCRKVYTHRNISGFAKHRRTAAEMLVSNS